MIRWAVYVAAAIGLGTASFVHLGSYFGLAAFWLAPPLHLGCFAVLGAAILARRVDGRDDHELDGPPWLGSAVAVFGLYALVNFLSCMLLNKAGSPDVIDGVQGLYSHGELITVLDDTAFALGQARVARLMSGHWMLFYAAGMAFAYPGVRSSPHQLRRKPHVESSGPDRRRAEEYFGTGDELRDGDRLPRDGERDRVKTQGDTVPPTITEGR